MAFFISVDSRHTENIISCKMKWRSMTYTQFIVDLHLIFSCLVSKIATVIFCKRAAKKKKNRSASHNNLFIRIKPNPGLRALAEIKGTPEVNAMKLNGP